MDLLSLPEASLLAEVSVTTLRNYIRDKRLGAYEKGGRLMVERTELAAVFGPKRVAPSRAGLGTRIIAIVNQMGRVGKTTTAAALATILAQEAPVLALDCDPQAGLTRAFGFEPDRQDQTLSDVLAQDMPLDASVLPVGPPPTNLALVPANLDLADTWRRVAGRVGLESLLKTVLHAFLPRYRYVILDCPPSLDMLTINALVAATEVIVPVEMSAFSVRGLVKLMGTMQEVRTVNRDLPPAKFVACQTEYTTVHKAIAEELEKKYGGSVFCAAIPRGDEIPAAQVAGRPLPFHAPMSRVGVAYEALAAEVRRA
ncbi:MAG: AAA family ATPase [Isosphaeraceae bacterium]|nr:AAA family ATPase [Isosphaeraceae bacterium]